MTTFGFSLGFLNQYATKESTVGVKQDIVNLRREGKTIRCTSQTLVISSTIWNVLKNKETSGVSSIPGSPRKTTSEASNEPKINLNQSDRKAKVWKKKGSAHDTNQTNGGRFMAWACVPASSNLY